MVLHGTNEMTQQEIKAAFNQVIINAKAANVDAKTIAEIELIREYYSNETFPQMLADFVAPIVFNLAKNQA